MVENLSNRFLINEIVVDLDNLSLQVDGQARSIEAKHAALLRLLIFNKGRVVTREEILDSIWPGVVVSDNSVSQLVTQLRRLLDDSSSTPQIIKTVPRLGYQCIAQVENAPTLLEKVEQLSRGRGLQFALLGFLSGFAITLMSVIAINYWQSHSEFKYLSATRATSSPGAEVFIRFSPNGKYLVYSYLAEGADQFDLAVYDIETKVTHTVKSSGYSEESASWSADGKWLIYSRSDPVSCEVRVLNTEGPIETWRLAKDWVLDSCNSAQDSAPWLEYQAGRFVTKAWDKHGSYLQSVQLSFEQDMPRIIDKKKLPLRGIMHYHISHNNLLYQTQEQGVYQVSLNKLEQADMFAKKISKQSYAAISQGYLENTAMVAGQHVALLQGDNEQVFYEGYGSISELDVSPKKRISAHTEGVAEVNFFELDLTQSEPSTQKQLTSPARMDVVATLSHDGSHFVYASVNTNNMSAHQYELWHKPAFRPTSSLLGVLPTGEIPTLLMMSPNHDFLAVLSKSEKVFLVSAFTKEVKKVIDGFDQVANIYWAEDGKTLFYTAKVISDDDWQNWRFDLSQGRSEQVELSTHQLVKDLVMQNASFTEYESRIQEMLVSALANQFDVEQLRVSIALYQPAVYQHGIYFVLKNGHQLVLYRYIHSEHRAQRVQSIGLNLYSGMTQLQVLASLDGQKVIFNRVNNVESDIVLLEYE